MKRGEAEAAIRKLCHQWREEANLTNVSEERLSFMEFYSWLRNNYPRYLDFQTTTSVKSDVDLWFDEEFGKTWTRQDEPEE